MIIETMPLNGTADTGHCRQLLPGEAVLQHPRLTPRGPGAHTMWTFREAGLIYDDDPARLCHSFLSVSQRLVFHRRTAASSRCMARPLGRWLVKPNRLSSRQTSDSQYRRQRRSHLAPILLQRTENRILLCQGSMVSRLLCPYQVGRRCSFEG